jgi:hypothetical protein
MPRKKNDGFEANDLTDIHTVVQIKLQHRKKEW